MAVGGSESQSPATEFVDPVSLHDYFDYVGGAYLFENSKSAIPCSSIRCVLVDIHHTNTDTLSTHIPVHNIMMLSRLQSVSRTIPVVHKSLLRPFAAAAATSLENHKLNINFALVKSEEGKPFSELKDHPVITLQGIGPKHSEELEQLGLKTIQQMADYKFYHLAKAIQTMAQTEETENRIETSEMNLNKGLDKAFEPYALQDLLEQPVHALQGLTPKAGDTFALLGVKNIGDLANFKYCQWAEAIVTAARFEE